MPCYFPIQGLLTTFPSGKRDWKPSASLSKLFTEGKPFPPFFDDIVPMAVPCGRCIGCRLENSRQWAVRCMHEASLYDTNSFITLTYDDDHLPENGSLVQADMQLFLKRLRKKYSPKKIRFFYCGEYGEKFKRPHYHALLFNHDFDDKVLLKATSSGKLWRSDELFELWPYGYNTIGGVSFKSAAYVARYCTKKVNGEGAFMHYSDVNFDTGEICTRVSEFAQPSLKPGLGKVWFEQNKNDVYPSDEIIVNGKPCKPPRYYDKLFAIDDPSGMEAIKLLRIEKALEKEEDNSSDRLHVKHVVKQADFGESFRPYEHGVEL